jgi:hypothetical protein
MAVAHDRMARREDDSVISRAACFCSRISWAATPAALI